MQGDKWEPEDFEINGAHDNIVLLTDYPMLFMVCMSSRCNFQIFS